MVELTSDVRFTSTETTETSACLLMCLFALYQPCKPKQIDLETWVACVYACSNQSLTNSVHLTTDMQSFKVVLMQLKLTCLWSFPCHWQVK